MTVCRGSLCDAAVTAAMLPPQVAKMGDKTSEKEKAKLEAVRPRSRPLCRRGAPLSMQSDAVIALWCGVVWCGVVWCGVVWCGVVWCGVVWCGVVCCDMM